MRKNQLVIFGIIFTIMVPFIKALLGLVWNHIQSAKMK